ncbi:Crp/Fnr family transcriptional regulator [Ferrimonas gelatinilytica]|uniref:cAMP-activated global transcriptional regulator CRP n=1 Tax=Ferrimonas gelatinilytica TaxID=1255257 RepID=A0ABP9SED8_9GAMM
MLAIPHMHNWYQGLSEVAKAAVDDKSFTCSYRQGENIYSYGDAANLGYRVLSGKVKIGNRNQDGREVIHATLMEGDCFGDIGLITGYPRFNYAIAATPVTLNAIRRDDFMRIMDLHPEVSRQLNVFFCHRAQHMFTILEGMQLLSLYERLANTIIRLTLSLGELKTEGDKPCYSLGDLSQEMLGQMVGATRQSVGRELKKLESEGYIEIRYGRLLVRDLEAMKARFVHLISHTPTFATYKSNQGEVA